MATVVAAKSKATTSIIKKYNRKRSQQCSDEEQIIQVLRTSPIDTLSSNGERTTGAGAIIIIGVSIPRTFLPFLSGAGVSAKFGSEGGVKFSTVVVTVIESALPLSNSAVCNE